MKKKRKQLQQDLSLHKFEDSWIIKLSFMWRHRVSSPPFGTHCACSSMMKTTYLCFLIFRDGFFWKPSWIVHSRGQRFTGTTSHMSSLWHSEEAARILIPSLCISLSQSKSSLLPDLSWLRWNLDKHSFCLAALDVESKKLCVDKEWGDYFQRQNPKQCLSFDNWSSRGPLKAKSPSALSAVRSTGHSQC